MMTNEPTDDLFDSPSDSEQKRKSWKNVSLKDIQGACDAGHSEDACNMLSDAPHLVWSRAFDTKKIMTIKIECWW